MNSDNVDHTHDETCTHKISLVPIEYRDLNALLRSRAGRRWFKRQMARNAKKARRGNNKSRSV